MTEKNIQKLVTSEQKVDKKQTKKEESEPECTTFPSRESISSNQ
jgi:hypothetical protein